MSSTKALLLLISLWGTSFTNPAISNHAGNSPLCNSERQFSRYNAQCLRSLRLRGGKDEDEDETLSERREGGSSALEKDYLLSDIPSDEAMISSMPSEAFRSFSNETDDDILAEANAQSWGAPYAAYTADGVTPSVLSNNFMNKTFGDDDGVEFSDVEAAKKQQGKRNRDALGVETDPLTPLDSSLLDAIKQGNTGEIANLILQGADPDVHDHDMVEMYGVHYAALHGHSAALERLLELGARLNVSSGTGDGVLQYAAEGGHVALIRQLVERLGVPVNAEGFADTSALHSAVEQGQLAALQALIELGADVNHTDMWSTSVLHFAAMQGRADMVSELVRRGADLEADDWAGRTPLQVAAEHGEEACCEALVEAGANLEAEAENGLNALQWARWRGRRSTARLLRRAMGLREEEEEEGGEEEGEGEGDAAMEDGEKEAGAGALVEGSRSWAVARVREIGRELTAEGGREMVAQSGKRKGLTLLTDMAGKIVTPSLDRGPAIGRPSNAGVCHLRNKQCRAQDCTRTAYYGDPDDGLRRFCREHRRVGDTDLKERAMPTPKWGGALPMPWNV